MNRLLQNLMIGGSTLALASVATMVAGPALAQDQAAAAADESIEQVVVTGTSIRGIAPIGSNVMAVGQVEMQKMGVGNVTEILANVPSIEFFGSAGRAPTTATNGQPGVAVEIHQVGAMSSASTLTLIDSHQAIETGNTNYYVDPNQIPANMLERVEVLADGSSAVYGSNAVAGVVNFITRSSYDGVQISGQETFANGFTGYQAGLLFGSSWQGGSLVFGSTWAHDGELLASERPYLDPLAQPARAAAHGVTGPGTSNFGNFFCAPATLAPAGQSLIWNGPSATSGVTNTANNQYCSQFANTSLLPVEERANAMLKVKQEFGRFTLGADMLIYHRHNQAMLSAGTLQGTAFKTGPQANPFYQQPAGYTGTATSETIRYDLNDLLGPGTSIGGTDVYQATVTANYNVDDNWQIDFMATTGRSDTLVETVNTGNGAAALLALNGTGQQNGSTTTTVIPGYNVVSLNLPLTTANAIDVWHSGSANLTSQAVKDKLRKSKGTSDGYFGMIDYRLSASGALFDLPAGPLKVAAGVEVHNYVDKQVGTNPGSAAPTDVQSLYYDYHFGRSDTAEYVEAIVPIISPEMGIPFVQKLEADVAARHDHYSDFGGTNNPKLGVNWDVMDGLRVRGNISTSFVAPVLTLEGGAQGLANFSGVRSSSGPGNVIVAYYPQATQFGLPNCPAANGTCDLSTLQGISNGLGGGPSMTPAKGRTYSIGIDYNPEWLDGFSTNVTYWSNTVQNAVATPQQAITNSNATLLDHLTLYPTCATAAQIDAFARSRTGFPVPQVTSFPSCVQFTYLSVSDNYLYLWVNGIDLQVDYRYETDDYGTFVFGDTMTEITRFSNAYSYKKKPTPDQIFSTLNTEGINTGYPALATTMRAHVGWEDFGFHADLYLNWSGAYKNVTTTAKTALINNANNVYSGMGGDHVNANTTFDLHMGYDFDGGFFGDDNISLNVNNIFDKKPPFYNSSTGYDNFLMSPVGRTITVALRSKL